MFFALYDGLFLRENIVSQQHGDLDKGKEIYLEKEKKLQKIIRVNRVNVKPR